jgi:hypothetical protein
VVTGGSSVGSGYESTNGAVLEAAAERELSLDDAERVVGIINTMRPPPVYRQDR